MIEYIRSPGERWHVLSGPFRGGGEVIRLTLRRVRVRLTFYWHSPGPI